MGAGARTAISVRDLSHRYGEVEALTGVSFDVPEGAFAALVGPNGGGKSTLLRVLSTLLHPLGGAASVAGADVTREADAVRRALGVVFQSPALDALLTVRENLCAVAGLNGIGQVEADARIAELSVLLNLDAHIDRPVGELSGGLRRRADLARGLLHRPRVLLLDEPTTALDPPGRDAFWAAVNALRRREGVTVLAATHLLDEAEDADLVLMLDRGRLVARDRPAALRATLGPETLVLTPADPAHAPALAAALDDDSSVDASPSDTSRSHKAALEGGSVRLPAGPGSLPEALAAAARAGIVLREATLRRPTLADVFRSRTALAPGDAALAPLESSRRTRSGHQHAASPPAARLQSAPPLERDSRTAPATGRQNTGRQNAGRRNASRQNAGRAVAALWRRDVTVFVRDRARLGASLAQPLAFWLLLAVGFGPSFRPAAGVAAGLGYGAYLVPGTLALVVVMTAIFATIHIVDERQSGFLQAALVAPVSRTALALGASSGGATLGLAQALLYSFAAPFVGVTATAAGWALAALFVALIGLGFTAVGFSLAWRLSTTRAYHGVMMGVLMPAWALSGALFPLDTLPIPARLIAYANPMTYAVEGLRGALGGASTIPPGVCLAATATFCVAALVLAARTARRAA